MQLSSLRSFNVSTPLLVSVVLFATVDWDHRPDYGPADGGQMGRVFSERFEWVLEDAEMRVDGQPLGLDLPPVEAEGSRRIVTESIFKTDEEGQVAAEERSFGKLTGDFSMSLEMNGESLEYPFGLVSPLAGESVVFTRDEDGEFGASWVGDSDRDEALLGGLSHLADFQALLPTESVGEGDTWEVPPRQVWSLLAPGGDVHFQPEDTLESDHIVPRGALAATGSFALSDAFGDDFDGDLELEFQGVEERGERNVASMLIKLSGVVARDRSIAFASALGLAQEDCLFEYELDLTGEGKLLWDMDANLPLSMELTVEFSATSEVTWPEHVDNNIETFRATYEVSGESVLMFKTE